MPKSFTTALLVASLFFAGIANSNEKSNRIYESNSSSHITPKLTAYLPSVTPPSLPMETSVQAAFHVNIHSKDLASPIRAILHINGVEALELQDNGVEPDLIANDRSYSSYWELDSFAMKDGDCTSFFVAAVQNNVSSKSEVAKTCVSPFPTESRPSGPLAIIVDPNTRQEFSAKEIIVWFKEGTRNSRIKKIAESVGCEVIQHLPELGYFVLGFDVPLANTHQLFEVLNNLNSLSEVVSANPNGIVSIQ